jgi:hypothetical protein
VNEDYPGVRLWEYSCEHLVQQIDEEAVRRNVVDDECQLMINTIAMIELEFPSFYADEDYEN